ncbi:MAG: NADH-quinone oxidoreductase subunit M [Planctomycetota bacterium]|nr:MAG: NADH-quinone oxidoreductase subunit M [Planctomycetota bacterium]
MELPILSILILVPLVGALVIAFVESSHHRLIQGIGLFFSLLTFGLSFHLWYHFSPNQGFQFVENYNWIPTLGISYFVGIDGLSLFLILLTTFLSPIVLLSSAIQIKKHIKEYYIVFLLLETGMLGVFMALDLFLFYIFWEAMLIPMYFIIGIWGGKRRIYATVKFFIYTMVGSLVMLLAILYVGLKFGTFNLQRLSSYTLTTLGLKAQTILFCAFALSFAIKVPTFPFHTWLPDAHVEAPTGGSVILAGVLLKMGGYGFLRFCFPLFPKAVVLMAPYMCIIGVIGIIYGALLAYAQTDLKKLVAYSSISHLGFVVLAIFSLNATAMTGGVYQMLNHGISTGALFLLVGVIYERRHTRLIADFGGIAPKVPVYATVFMIILLSSIGLPPLNGFVGEFLILLGSFQTFPYMVGFAVLGVVLGALYMLSMFRRVFFGRLIHRENENLKDMNWVEHACLLPLVAMVFIMGLFPTLFLGKINKSSITLLRQVEQGTGEKLVMEKKNSLKKQR